MLDVHALSGGWGMTPVIHGVDLQLHRGETVALLGPNGAGKSTLLAALTGTLPERSGKVLMDGEYLLAMPSHRIVAHGLALVPEGRHVFTPLSVIDNLMLGSIRLADRNRHTVAERLESVFKLFPRLAERRDQLAGTLSGGSSRWSPSGGR
ncbi:ATP-binding cassette domain-containing protein [Diaphorobacter aerolatus]|uniref:ATP-binding cassette domain-containing protein n=1 Tax=Diaphorobacter aerolatus TaxID=1288495 RepID=UPI001D00AB29|nr:ATP-binding cassette domain-containing protein [Diaphorobacter aerolatus]